MLPAQCLSRPSASSCRARTLGVIPHAEKRCGADRLGTLHVSGHVPHPPSRCPPATCHWGYRTAQSPCLWASVGSGFRGVQGLGDPQKPQSPGEDGARASSPSCRSPGFGRHPARPTLVRGWQDPTRITGPSLKTQQLGLGRGPMWASHSPCLLPRGRERAGDSAPGVLDQQSTAKHPLPELQTLFWGSAGPHGPTPSPHAL